MLMLWIAALNSSENHDLCTPNKPVIRIFAALRSATVSHLLDNTVFPSLRLMGTSRLTKIRSMSLLDMRCLVARTPLTVTLKTGLFVLTMYKMLASVELALLLS